MRSRATRATLVLVTLALVLVTALPASAGEVIYRHGKCSRGIAEYSVEFKNDFGPTLEVSAFVDTPTEGRAWHVNMRHNGSVFLSMDVMTGPNGNFEVDGHHPAKPLLPDTLVFKAFNRYTGEVCKASATLS